MSAIPYEGEEEGWDGYEDDQPLDVPGRRRRPRWSGPATAAVIAAVVGAACFYAGVRVEKGQVSSAPTTVSSLTGARGGTAGARSASSRTASLFGGGRGGGFAGALGGGANGAFGTVSSVKGNTIYVTETSTGDVVKVTLSSATTISKSLGVSKKSIHPGDSVLVQGVKGSVGTISATSVSDSGSRSGASGASSSGSSASSSSAVNSLFGGSGSGK